MTVVSEDLTHTLAAELHSLQSPYDTLQPIRDISDTAGLAGRIATSVTTGEILPAVVFWGPDPAREHPDSRDQRTLRMLGGLFDNLTVRPNISLRLILADAHGAFNGYDNQPYLEGIAEMARGVGAGALWLSDLYRQYGLPLDERGAPTDFGDLPDLTDEQGARIIASSNRIAGRGDPGEYVAMRRQELPIVQDLLKTPGGQSRGVFMIIGDPEASFLSDHAQMLSVFTRSRGRSGGSRYSNTAPWIKRSNN